MTVVFFLLNAEKSVCLSFYPATGKQFYKVCVKAFNRKVLNGRIDTPWRKIFNIMECVKPEWGTLYKPPLSKQAGDLQWKVLHCALGVNAFISGINPGVSEECPFCFKRL